MFVSMRQIHHFITLVEQGSLGKAAKVVNLTQPALSKSIKQLEERLGVVLVDRTTNGIILNIYGESFLHYAKSIRSEMAQAQGQLDSLRGLRTGSISVGTGPSMALTILPDAICKFRDLYPGAQANIVVDFSTILTRKLLSGELDFVLATRLETERENEISHRELYVDKCGIVCGPEHRILNLPNITLHDLSNMEWVMSEKHEIMRNVFERVFQDNGERIPPIAMTTNSASFMQSVVAKSNLLAFLPKQIVKQQVDEGKVVFVDHDICRHDHSIYVNYKANKLLPPLSDALIKLIKHTCE